MAQITKGTTYSSGDSVTAQNLNEHVDLAILQDGAITDQAVAGAPSANDKLLVSQSNALKQISWQSLCATPQAIGSTTPSTVAATSATVSGTLTVGGITTINNNAAIDGAVTINDSGANKDTRIEGDTDANLVFVKASNDRVGIGTSSPSTKLDVNGGAKVSGAFSVGSTATFSAPIESPQVCHAAGRVVYDSSPYPGACTVHSVYNVASASYDRINTLTITLTSGVDKPNGNKCCVAWVTGDEVLIIDSASVSGSTVTIVLQELGVSSGVSLALTTANPSGLNRFTLHFAVFSS